MKNLLIVDDSDLIRDRIKSIASKVENLNIVGEASNSLQALEMANTLNPDVILLDIRMPGGNGLEVLSKIRKTNTQIVIVIITNYPFEQYRKAAFELGADYFIDKTHEFDKIPEVLKSLN